MLQEVVQYIALHQDRYMKAVLTHLRLDATALLLCVLIAVPLGYWGAKRPRLASILQNASSALRIVPSIAVFLLLMPVMGLGSRPAVIALVIISVPTLMMNTIAGIRSVEPMVVESARAMGLTGRQVFWQVELPLAMPTLLGGLRISAVSIIAGTTIASYVGAGGLGDFIVSGLSQHKYDVMLAGALTVALLSIATDLLLAALQRRAIYRLIV